MSHHNHLLHLHLSKRKRKDLLDRIAMVAAFVYPAMGLPQVWHVFHGTTDGVSLVSWIGFMVFSTLFLLYGFAHRIKPLIITNAIWLAVDTLVVAGVLLDRTVV